MSSLNFNYCHTGCSCNCHQNYGTYSEESSAGKRRDLKEQRLRLCSQYAKKNYETSNRLLTISSGGFENTTCSFGNWNNQPPLIGSIIRKKRPEDISHSSEIKQRYINISTDNYNTIQPKSRCFDKENEQLTTEVNDLKWQKEKLTFKLEKMTKEKNSAVAMSSSLQRILNDYSSKTRLQCGDESFKNLLLNEARELRDRNYSFQKILNETFDFLKGVSIKEGTDMREPRFYIENDGKYREFLDRLYQCLYGLRKTELNEIKENAENQSINNYYSNTYENPTFKPEDNNNKIEDSTGSYMKINDMKEQSVTEYDGIFNKIPYKEEILYNDNNRNINSNNSQMIEEKTNSDQDRKNEEVSFKAKTETTTKKRVVVKRAKPKSPSTGKKNNCKNKSIEKNPETKGSSVDKTQVQDDFVYTFKTPIPTVLGKIPVVNKLTISNTNTNTNTNARNSPKKTEQEANKPSNGEHKDDILYKKKKAILLKTKSQKKININTDYCKNLSKGNISSHRYENYSNKNINNITTNSNKNNRKISNYNTYNRLYKMKNNIINTTVLNESKESATRKLCHYKSQSMTNIQTEYQPNEDIPEDIQKINQLIKNKLKKAFTQFVKKRAQSPIKQENCTACHVDCNVSSTGYSPMTYSPFGDKVKRNSITPTKDNPPA